ncbi:MAG: hypothetical protein AABZ47_01120 [Planctomycetota bacterium]
MVRTRRVAIATLVLLETFGCASHTRKFQPPQNIAELDNTSFLHYLATVPVVTVEEGCRAWMLLLEGSNRPQLSHLERQLELERRGILNPTWHLKEGDVLNKGTLAFMIRTTCRLSKSPTERLASLFRVGERRYALKTCVFEGLISYGTADEPVTGGELLSTLTKMEMLNSESVDNSFSGRNPSAD